MKRSIAYSLISFFLCLLLCACTKESTLVDVPVEKRFSPEKEAKLEAALNKAMLEYQIPGVIAGVWFPNEGTWVKARGTANLATNEPMRIENHFRMASITKTFTGTAALKLVEAGKLNLDSSLAYYLPQYPFPKAGKITVRMLGNMTSGIFNYSADMNLMMALVNDNFENEVTADSLVKSALQHPLNFDPGSAYSYSNTNTILLAFICEKVAGKTIDVLVQEMILTPYGLTNTFWPKNRFLPEPFSHGYTLDFLTNGMKDATYFHPSWGGAAGVLISNIYDLCRWARLLGNGSLYSPAMHAERTKWTAVSGNQYGFALFDIAAGWIGHDGSIPGFTTSCFYLPSADAVIVVNVNSDMTTAGNTPADLVFINLAKIVTPSSAPAKTADQKNAGKNVYEIR